MDVPFGLILGATSKIAEYFGLIQGVDTKVTKLLHQSFNSAKSNLEYALSASGQNQIDYIKQAKNEFNQATQVEENENKILALVGLSMCQFLLGDKENATVTYNKIESVNLSNSERNKCIAKAAGASTLFAGLLSTLAGYDPIKERIDRLEQTKKNAKLLKSKILQ